MVVCDCVGIGVVGVWFLVEFFCFADVVVLEGEWYFKFLNDVRFCNICLYLLIIILKGI